jgi:hypothetical protein
MVNDAKLVIGGKTITPEFVDLVEELTDQLTFESSEKSTAYFRKNLFMIQNALLRSKEFNDEHDVREKMATALYRLDEFAEKLENLIRADRF